MKVHKTITLNCETIKKLNDYSKTNNIPASHLIEKLLTCEFKEKKHVKMYFINSNKKEKR